MDDDRQKLTGKPVRPHAATVAQQKAPHPAAVLQPKAAHPATVLQPKAPHPATVLQPRAPHPATVLQPKPAHLATAGRAAQPFWLNEGNGVNWVEDEQLDPEAFRDTGKKQWWSSWLPTWAGNTELPVYARAQIEKKSNKPREGSKKVPKKKAPPPLTDEEWTNYVKTTLEDWVDERGGIALTKNAPQDYEFKAIWAWRPDRYDGAWDQWQDLKLYYRKASGVEKTTRPVYRPTARTGGSKVKKEVDPGQMADEYVKGILGEIKRNIGCFPVYAKKDNAARAGCVMFGPAYTVPRVCAKEIYQELLGLEGSKFEGGRLHIVKKSAHNLYNVTLHRDYRGDNPRTMVNMHIDVS